MADIRKNVHGGVAQGFDIFAHMLKESCVLAYFNSGKRRYFDNPLAHQIRPFWEFQAVVQGRIGWVGRDAPHVDLRSKTLWISPPGTCHTWTGVPHVDASIVVFHFRYIPETLASRLSHTECTTIALSSEECRQIRRLGARISQYWHQPAAGMLLCYEHALLELSVLSYESMLRNVPPPEQSLTDQRVKKALLWYNEHMHENPGLPEISRAVHSSPANLRRLFHEALQASPKEMFDQLRYQRAMQLLTETSQPLAQIAQECGFQDQSAFSRAFKHHFHCSPRDIRIAAPAP